jgi:hypothetical protein
VTSDNGVITLSGMAQKPYALIVSGQAKAPVLSVVCQQKGKKIAHASFCREGIAGVGDDQESATGVSHGNLQSFGYVGRTEPECIHLMQIEVARFRNDWLSDSGARIQFWWRGRRAGTAGLGVATKTKHQW